MTSWWKNLSPQTRSYILRGGLALAAVLAVAAYFFFVNRTPAPSDKPQGPTPAPPPKALAHLEKKIMPTPGVRGVTILDAAEVSKKLKWVPEIQDNVAAAGEVQPWAGKTTVIATVKVVDNVLHTELTTRQEKPPFFQLKKEFGARLGAGTGGLILGEIYARPFRIGGLDVEARGFARRDNRNGADFGGVVLIDMRF